MLNTLKAERLFYRGQKLFRAGQIESSLAAFDRAVQARPDAGRIHMHRAIALAEQKRYTEAIVDLQTAITLKPGNSARHLWLGIVYFDTERLTEALAQFEAALNISADNDLAACFRYLTLAAGGNKVEDNCKNMLGKVEYTNTAFKSRLLLFTESFALENQARARFLNDALFHQAYLTNNPSPPSAFSGWMQNAKSAYRRMQTRLVYALAPAARNAALHVGAGVEMLKHNRLDEAETEFKQAVRLRPDFEEARLLLIDLYLYRKKFQDAGMMLKSDEAYRDIASILYDNTPLAERVKDLSPHMSLVLALGIHHFYAGQYQKAIRLLTFIAGFSDNYYDDYYLGLCHLARGDKHNASACFQNSICKLNPALATGRLKEVLRLRQ